MRQFVPQQVARIRLRPWAVVTLCAPPEQANYSSALEKQRFPHSDHVLSTEAKQRGLEKAGRDLRMAQSKLRTSCRNVWESDS